MDDKIDLRGIEQACGVYDEADVFGGEFTTDDVRALVAAVRAATEVACNVADDVDPRLRYVIVQPQREEWASLLAALDRFTDGEADDA